MEKKILFTASTYSHIVHFHLPYLRFFRRQGWIVHVACGGESMEIPDADHVIAVPFQKSMTSPDNFRAACILRNYIQQERYTLVSTHTSLAAFFTRLAVSGLRERPLVVNTVHGYLFDENTPLTKRTILLTAEQWMAPVTDLLLTMNGWDFETAQRYHLGARIAQIPGIGVNFQKMSIEPGFSRTDFRLAHGIPPEAFVLVYAAEFSKRKSQSVLIRAMTQLPERCILVLAGSGAQMGECEEIARQEGVSGRVLFPGYVSDVAAWYAAADAAVSGSRIEGLPFHVMEAMHAGLPVVASAVKGHQDLISDGESGFLYPYGNSEACAACVGRLMSSETLRERMTQRARADAARYDLAQVFPMVVEQYAGLLQEDFGVATY